ncbi:hypothetical protein B7463_g5071, partial [Scytalidium lignicola]
MAVLVSKTMAELNEERKPIHPFFDKSRGSLERSKKENPPGPEKKSPIPVENDSSKISSSTRLAVEVLAPNPTVTTTNSLEAQLEVDPNDGRRKRQRTDSPGAGDIEQVFAASDNIGALDNLNGAGTKNPRSSDAEGDELSQSPSVVEDQGITTDVEAPPTTVSGQNDDASHQDLGEPSTATKPRKILLLNTKTGTIGSPPKKFAQSCNNFKKPTPRGKKPKTLIVTIRYGQDQRLSGTLGIRIDQIVKSLSGKPTLEMKPETKPSPKTTSSFATSKTTHPFFLGKIAPKPLIPPKTNDEQPKPLDTTISPSNKAPEIQRSLSKPAGPFLVFGNAHKTMKFPGAIEPAWPWQGMVHIHGYESIERPYPYSNTNMTLSDIKKSKYQAVEVLANEDILNSFSIKTKLCALIEEEKHIETDTFTPPPACLRVPEKHFESGRVLQQPVRKQLHAKFSTTRAADNSLSEDELQQEGPPHSRAHSALFKAFDSIATSLSAFDKCQCETQCWTQKYAPKCASDVLQSGKEALLLKEWLERLTVTSVDTGSGDKQSSQSSSSSRRSGTAKSEKSGKRKRKCRDLEGFIISSDEEDNYMDEISDPEDIDLPQGGDSLHKKTLIRMGDALAKSSKDPARLTNAVVISGPHGCGKTAAVYAVAKELGFEVFEISPNSRRSGKDVLEKVGDMTRNHLVQQSHDVLQRSAEDDDTNRISDALADDLRTGRQGTMNSFFKKKDRTVSKLKPTNPAAGKRNDKGFSAKQQKQQKQSLILLEEVDVLYEEDKQFWATIISMISQSKRPIIMTCNNESAVPFQALSLHAIIRFNSPPVNLAVDYLLLVAANEGHLIRRKAVEALYESRKMDLRASISELNFWCQFAVGDCKGGLGWFYPRWPRGSDVDDHGDTIRVISQDTYQTGMGWLCRDFQHTGQHLESERMREALDGWGLDVGDWHETLDIVTWADAIPSRPHADLGSDLSMYEDFTRTMSDSDILSGSYFAPDNKEALDVSLPPLSSKSREDYILGYGLLEASPRVFYDDIRIDMSIWLKSQARESLQEKQIALNGKDIASHLSAMNDESITDVIRAKSKSSTSNISLNRNDFSLAFDPVSEPEKSTLHAIGSLEPSAFDRPLNIITLDLAPYVRSIVSYDMRLQRERHRLSSLLTQGGARGKRMRTTRSAMSALEGGTRSTTRRERYFGPNLNPHLVMRTGEPSWMDAALLEIRQEQKTMTGSRRSSVTEGSMTGEYSEGLNSG